MDPSRAMLSPRNGSFSWTPSYAEKKTPHICIYDVRMCHQGQKNQPSVLSRFPKQTPLSNIRSSMCRKQSSAICKPLCSATFSGGRLRGQAIPDPERAPCRGPSMDSYCDSVSGHCARDHRSLGALCEAGGDGHHVHPTSFGHLLAACHLSAAHRVGLNQAHSLECMYPHPCLLYQRFRLLAPSMGGDRDLGPGRGLYIHVDDPTLIRRLRLPTSGKTEGNPVAVTCCRDGHVTSRAFGHWGVVDS